jgi:hypothetical protein
MSLFIKRSKEEEVPEAQVLPGTIWAWTGTSSVPTTWESGNIKRLTLG